MSAFLDFSAADFPAGVGFWASVTGSTLSPARGDDGEFATLVPADGDDVLRVQRVGSGGSRVHLDVHVGDPRGVADRAIALGATEVADHGYVVLRSPSGLTFCCVPHPASVRPIDWGGHTSLVDQICLDIPPGYLDVEQAFWATLTGWTPVASRVSGSFRPFVRPDGQPLRLMLQELEDDGGAGFHLDLAVSDREAETARHLALGARLVGVHSRWTVLRGPAGLAYCLTDRNPATGLLDD